MTPIEQPSFAVLVDEQIRRLQEKSLRTIEADTIAKRATWCRGHLGAITAPTPRMAFETLFFRYMGLHPEDLPVVSEDAHQITWSSQNPCPTLEACQRLGLDTRKVCRKAYEKSTQAFLSCIDPQLRFLRNYDEIRPYSSHCEEQIVRISFEDLMQRACVEANVSLRTGNKGYGAIAVLGDRVLCQTHDTAITERDPSLHAEMKALREAARVLGTDNLSGVVLASTCEPCPMCTAMAVWSNVSTIVYGASIAETAAQGKSRILVTAEQIIRNAPVQIEIIPDVLRDECLKLYA
jgi:tRNA(Arg) A34 adenosine deaminase TadA